MSEGKPPRPDPFRDPADMRDCFWESVAEAVEWAEAFERSVFGRGERDGHLDDWRRISVMLVHLRQGLRESQ